MSDLRDAEPEAEPVKTLDLSNRALTHTNLRLLPASLTCLDLTRCSLEGLDSLGLLPQLELLNVSYNKLASLELRQNRALKVLYARSNRVAALEPLAALDALRSLDLECNAIASLEALQPLWALGGLADLRLRGNMLPLASYRRLCAQHLPSLATIDGVPTGRAARRAAGGHARGGAAARARDARA